MTIQTKLQILLLCATLLARFGDSFQLESSFLTKRNARYFVGRHSNKRSTGRYLSTDNNQENDSSSPISGIRNDIVAGNEVEIKFARSATPPTESAMVLDASDLGHTSSTTGATGEQQQVPDKAVTNTVNERLMAELKAQEQEEKYGARSSMGKRLRMVDGYGRPRKTDAEIQASIDAARDLNGVNPIIALTGSFFALGVAAGLWYATGQLGNFFALHPVDSDVYFVQRSAQVVRNVSMGMISLASGFFGVTGLGIFLLGVRVSYGVVKGELDPTPIKRNQQAQKEKVDWKNMFDLMTNKKPNRRGSRGGEGGSDNNLFGL